MMKPKPLGSPVCRSLIITESVISPYFPKCLLNSAASSQKVNIKIQIQSLTDRQREEEGGGDLLLVVSLCNPPMNIFLRDSESKTSISATTERYKGEGEKERRLPWASAIAGLKVFVARSGPHLDSRVFMI